MNAARIALPLLFITSAAFAAPPWLPRDPGAAHCAVRDGVAQLDNEVLRFEADATDGALRPAAFDNRFTGNARTLQGELFSLKPREGDEIPASALKLAGKIVCENIAVQPNASRAANRRKGVALKATLNDAAHGLTVQWRASLRDGVNYVREEVRLQPARELDLASISMTDLQLPGAIVEGTADGSPIIDGDEFFGFEFPMAQAKVIGGHATMLLRRALPLRANVSVEYSAVFGVTPKDQLRRGFLAYIEDQRAHPYRTFLHYNSWYDIGYFNRYTQAEALREIDAFGEQPVRQRGVTMDSFLFDDGWDDPNHLWQFNSGFPDGFVPLKNEAAKFGAAPGIWLSPWGGYGPPRKQRLAAARADGFAVDEQGIALSDPKYFVLFKSVTEKLLREDGINQFKLDGTGSPDKVTPGSDFDSDFAAAIALIDDLRAIKPDLFINLTTGTWPSPFWLRWADSIWRGGEDHSFAGVGSDRQRWITYRDSDTYGGIVRLGPLYPLNSLMLHGIIYARYAQGLNTDPQHDFADEVHSYFASGTGLQELYISPDLLSDQDWDTLAAASKWSRERAGVLRDSHWVGGDPARLEVYGWASWMPKQAVLALRNPSDKPQTFNVDIASALQLPDGAARTWHATSPFGDSGTRTFTAGRSESVKLKPFQVVVWDLTPDNKRS
ncbi:MAG TPA: enterotoxin [Rhodanobacteraceae bacterium]|nr:enterotoxin [Rhodanobacteraceae bacterium]